MQMDNQLRLLHETLDWPGPFGGFPISPVQGEHHVSSRRSRRKSAFFSVLL